MGWVILFDPEGGGIGEAGLDDGRVGEATGYLLGHVLRMGRTRLLWPLEGTAVLFQGAYDDIRVSPVVINDTLSVNIVTDRRTSAKDFRNQLKVISMGYVHAMTDLTQTGGMKRDDNF